VHVNLLLAGQTQQSPATVGHFEKTMTEGRRLRQIGQLADAVKYFQRAANEAKRGGNLNGEAEALVAESGCEIRLFRYAVALKNAQEASDSALRANNSALLGAAAGNISTIYSQLGDFISASKAADTSVEHLKHSPRKDYAIKSLASKGEIEFGLRNFSEAKSAFHHAVELARQAGLFQLEALAADHFGTWLLLTNDLPQAELNLDRALEIYKQQNDKDGLAICYEHLAELELRKGKSHLQSALNYINQAFSLPSKDFKTYPQSYPLHTRAEILLGLGERDKALVEFRRAVNAADTWRQSALPGDATSTRTVAELQDIYHDYAELAAELAIQRHNQALAADAFEVLARNRAASLREQLTRSYSRKFLLSPEYYELLQRLQTTQAAVTLANNPARSRENERKLAQIRADLSDFENRIGLQQNFFPGTEINRHQNSLKGIQSRLGGNEALLSFSLGKRKSFLWAITNSELRLYELPNQETIEKEANDFSRAVAEKWPNRDSIGQKFGSALFGKTAPFLAHKQNWLLTVDGKLLDKVPFSALPIYTSVGAFKPLGTVHTLRFLPSALLLYSPKTRTVSPRFVGVGDPIYNRADARNDHAPASGASEQKTSSLTTLARLVGSEREIQRAAKASGLPETETLTGKKASGAELRQALTTSPEILHFAVHVVSPKEHPGEAALALSLDKNNIPELLTAESVATYRTPGSLVVLSGCASQQGEVLPGAGLVGLSRAWLLAGASAVIVSAWPTPDDSGQFFSIFYGHFQQTSGPIAQRAAMALQRTQSDMQSSGGYRSDASFWAAYSIISKE